MKKVLLLVMCLVLCLAVFAACTEQPNENPSGSGTESTVDTGNDTSESGTTESNTGDCTHTGGTATCTALAVCEVCGEAYGELAEHIFDKELAEAKYIASEATCTAKATYYKSCVCGEKGSETFESGSMLPHSYAGDILWTATEGVYTAKYTCENSGCAVSRVAKTITIPATAGISAIVFEEDALEFKFTVTPTTGYYVVSVKVGDTALVPNDEGVYSTDITEGQIDILMSNMYEIKFVDFDDTVIETFTLAYGATTGKPVDPYREPANDIAYNFAGWTPALKDTVDGNATYKATYTETPLDITYTITWNIGGTTTKTFVEKGTVPVPPDTTKAPDAQYTYTFSHWDSEIVAATGDATYTAVYTTTINKYTITFMSSDGKTVLQTGEVEYGTVPTYTGEAPISADWFDFARVQLSANVWDKPVVAVTENATYTVKYEKLYEYTVFAIENGSVSETAAFWGGKNIEFSVSTRANINKADKYRITLSGIDMTNRENVSFSFMVNYDGITLSTVDGTLFLTVIENTSYQMTIDKDGKVYINGVLLSGVTMSDGVIAFDITRNPDTDLHAYFEATDISYDVEIKTPFISQLKDMYTEDSGINGTKNVTPATDSEKLALGVTQFTTFTSGGFQERPFDNFDLTPYNTVKFYAQRISGGSIKIAGQTFYCNDLTEIKFVKNGDGYDMYVAGEKQDLGETVLTNLNQIKFNINTGSFKYSDIVVDAESYVPPKSYTGIDGTIYTGAALEASPETAPAVDGLTGLQIYSYTAAGWANASFNDINLMQYNDVKFYVMSVTKNGSIKTSSDGGDTGTIAYLSDGTWKEIHLVKNSAGTGFDVYVNGTLSAIKFYTDNKKTTEIPLTNLKQLTLNQNTSNEFLMTNLFVDSASVVPEEKVNFTAVPGKIFGNSTVVDSPSSTPELDDNTGLEIYTYTMSEWGNVSLSDIDLLSYDEVKFYVKRVDGGDVRTNSDGGLTGRFVDMSDTAWHEFHLVKNSAGTGFDVYVDGALSSVKFYTDSKRETEVPLTNMNQFALNGSSGEFLFSNLFVYAE